MFCPSWLRMQPLKSSALSGDSFSFSLATNLALVNSISFLVAKSSSANSSVLSICILTSLNMSLVVVISRHRSYVDVVIRSFSL